MRWLVRCLAATFASILVIGVISFVLVDSGYERVVETAFAPVFWACRSVTPSEWQFQGNVLLGLAWFFMGIAFYGLVSGISYVVCIDFLRRRQRKVA